MMESLIAQFNRCTQVTTYSSMGCHVQVRYDAELEGVVAMQSIAPECVIGEIFGEPAYVWDITHSEYLFIDEDMIIDVSGQPTRQILSFLREDNQTVSPANCAIVPVQEGCTGTRFFIVATKPISVGDELVYAVPHRFG